MRSICSVFFTVIRMKKEIDIYDYPKRIESAVRSLGKAPISESNRKTILDFRASFLRYEDAYIIVTMSYAILIIARVKASYGLLSLEETSKEIDEAIKRRLQKLTKTV